MSNNATLDPSKHRIRIAGYLMTGFAPDIGFNSSMDTEAYGKIVGNRGLGGFTRTISGAATITINLMAQSADNTFLSTLYAADAAGGGVLVPLTKTTENAGLLVEGGLVRVNKMPDTSDGSSAVVTWTLISVNYTKFVGGYDATAIANTLEELQAIIAQAPPIQAPV